MAPNYRESMRLISEARRARQRHHFGRPQVIREPVYTHVLPNGTNINIRVEPIRRMLLMFERNPAQRIPTTQVEVQLREFWTMYHNNEFDPHRVMELARRDPKTLDPVIWGIWDDPADGGFLMDGRHRYALAALWGRKTIDAWLVPATVWRDFTIDQKPMTMEEFRDLPIRKRDY